MRRALRYAAIWCGATAVAVSVSWFGVRGVLRDEFVDDVDVEPFAAQTIAADEAPLTLTSPSPTPSPSRAPGKPVKSPTKSPVKSPVKSPAPRKPLKVVKVKGGEVAFTLGPEGCRLVSATPVSGYTAKVARATGWIRVDLVKGEHGTGVFCISHEQRTDTWEY
ncbi:hypothetical protein ACFPOI_57120 [Nonomuraea angiospora]|uniref:Secreted protein n=1 Tax=Nonomuraea angiospora TaxID=46172 RepID=A0ABR9M033_9ACTN|nr:hypothetical protein [Nonomuraea angiospora]MBE1586259.1 hypothetical protein [Nonomuraea angiospora]